MSEAKERLLLFIGSYAEPADTGVYVYELDESTGEFASLDAASGLKNPTFVSVNARSGKLYAISEAKSEDGGRSGEAVSFSIDAAAGSLTEINRIRTIRPSTSHIQIDHEFKFLAVSGYHGGNVGLIKLAADGVLLELSDEQQHEGHGADPVRQDRPHPHSALFSPDNRHMLVADLGLDLVRTYAVDTENGTLQPVGDAMTPPGSGPRHLAFHPGGKFIYSINEVGNSITSFQYDVESGRLTPMETLSTLPDDFEGENTTAEIAISRDGMFLYGSNRGHDSIVQFGIHPESGRLSYVEHVSTEGGHPRHFALTPSGNHLIVANRDSNNLVLFRVDRENGRLQSTGQTATVSKPVCVKPVLCRF
ncbi:6-phosphogluconolactonase [Fontibacillus phaseoli]|uniref:6-phosphogluconolactonase n=1 Tax=Fontibacillus phaseoli TaxID=1416533 RepID=A0A369BIJ1_9BACL|nr:lactonase family protein [Fontibacillus phaseoli]RCX21393.1 6-phosphogluconolactonase [Fontibacillus phaseoli]